MRHANPAMKAKLLPAIKNYFEKHNDNCKFLADGSDCECIAMREHYASALSLFANKERPDAIN